MENQLSERQEQIVDVAMRILATEGARRFTVQALSSEIGVTGGAIYRHFDSMEAIVDAVIERMGTILFREFPPEAADPLERLRIFFLGRSQTIRENPHISRLLLSDNLAQSCGAERGEQLVEFKRRTSQFVMGCLEEARAAGTLHPELSPQVGVIIVMGGILALSHIGAGLRGDDRVAESVWSALGRVLRKPEVPPCAVAGIKTPSASDATVGPRKGMKQ